MAHRKEWQKRIRSKLRFIFLCNFYYKILQIWILFSELSKRFEHKYSWVFTQDVRFCCRTATTAAAQLRSTKCGADGDDSLDWTANWLPPASDEMTALALLLQEEDTASFFTIKFLKTDTGNGCPHNVSTQHTLQFTAAHTAANLCLQFLYLLSVRTQLLEHLIFNVCYTFRPFWPPWGGLSRHAADDNYIVQ